MAIFNGLKSINDVGKAIFGFGFVKSMNYETQRRGYLIMFSYKSKFVKLFIPF